MLDLRYTCNPQTVMAFNVPLFSFKVERDSRLSPKKRVRWPIIHCFTPFWLGFIRPGFIGELGYILDVRGNELTLKETASGKASTNKSAEFMASTNV